MIGGTPADVPESLRSTVSDAAEQASTQWLGGGAIEPGRARAQGHVGLSEGAEAHRRGAPDYSKFVTAEYAEAAKSSNEPESGTRRLRQSGQEDM